MSHKRILRAEVADEIREVSRAIYRNTGKEGGSNPASYPIRKNAKSRKPGKGHNDIERYWETMSGITLKLRSLSGVNRR